MAEQNTPFFTLTDPETGNKINVQRRFHQPEGLEIISDVRSIYADAPLLIYGTGNCAKELFQLLKKHRPEVTVKGFADSFKPAGSFCAKPLINLSALPGPESGLKIIIASCHYHEILTSLLERGYSKLQAYVTQQNNVEMYRTIVKLGQHNKSGRLKISDTPPSCESPETNYIFNVDNAKYKLGVAEKEFSELPEKIIFTDNQTPISINILPAEKSGKELCIIDHYGHRPNLVNVVGQACTRSGSPAVVYKHPRRIQQTLILEAHKSIFIIIPKNGSSSLARVLDPIFRNMTSESRVFKNLRNYVDITSNFLDGYSKYAVVRNPYERLASFYHHIKRFNEDEFLNVEFNAICSPFNFDTFCRFVADCPDEFSDPHFRSQSSFLTTPDGLLKTELIRMETYADDLLEILNSWSENPQIPHCNKSNGSGIDYIKECYTPKLIRLVSERFEKDFINFGYDFL